MHLRPTDQRGEILSIILFFRAAEALVELLSIEDLEKRATFPDNYPIREVYNNFYLFTFISTANKMCYC